MATEQKMRFAPVGSGFDLPELENGVLDLWEREASFDVLRQKNSGAPRYSFIDGPITANIEAMGVHHAWGRTYKDLYQRYKAMQGFDQRWQNGFDCQGLWVEVQVERELNLNSKRDIETYGIDKFSRACRARVDRSAAAITKQSIRLGQWMDWDNSYYTYSDNNISHIWSVLKLCHEKGWLYKGHRAMPWCARCGTALAEHEMTGSYKEMTHDSLYVRFPVLAEGRGSDLAKQRASFLAWTTTPWTLPANVMLAVHPDLDYVKVRVVADGATEPELLILGAKVYAQSKWHNAEVVGTVKGRDLIGLRYAGPFDELPAGKTAAPAHKVIAWDEVGEAEGTGIVHIAPGCGAEDFALGKREDAPVLVPIDENAQFVSGFGWLEGRDARDVAHEIADDLRKRGRLFRELAYTHSYPICWRCKEEIVFRVGDEWFISMDELRPKLKEAATKVRWLPSHTGDRMQNWLDNMGDWNISRKRYWGLPLPFYTCANGHFFIIGSQNELRERAVRGLEQLQELHRPWIDKVVVSCPTCKAESVRVRETGDVWLDAGIVPFSTLNWLTDRGYWKKWFPAEFITENVEQIRLWYYSQLFFSVVLTGRAPYETVLSHEFVYDEIGDEFHKSGENFIDFPQAAERVGSDIVRWFYMRLNPADKVLFGYNVLSEVKRKLLVLWNTYAFFVTYANVDHFDPAAAVVPARERPLIDRWLLSSLHRLVRDVRGALDAYDSQTACLKMEAFWDDLSTWYVRRNRSRFWKARSERDSLAAYQTLYEALTTLIRLFAPVMPFIAEETLSLLRRGAHRGRPGTPDACRAPRRRTGPRRAILGWREDADASPEAHRRVRRERSRPRRFGQRFRAGGDRQGRAQREGDRDPRRGGGPGEGDREAGPQGARTEARQGSPARAAGARRGSLPAARRDDLGRRLRALGHRGPHLARRRARARGRTRRGRDGRARNEGHPGARARRSCARARAPPEQHAQGGGARHLGPHRAPLRRSHRARVRALRRLHKAGGAGDELHRGPP